MIYAQLKLTNPFNEQFVEFHALVDTRAKFIYVTEAIAHQLGFDTTEVSTQFVRTADGGQLKVPKIAPIEIAFENRTNITEALVLGDEPLMGVLPLEAMDLVVDPKQQRILVNPAHPNNHVALAK